MESSELVTSTLHIPSSSKRFLALLIDGLVVSAPIAMGYNLGGIIVTETELTFLWPFYFSSMIFALGFQIFCLHRWARTPGKFALGLYVTDAKTLQPKLSLRQATLRVLSSLLCFPLSLAPQSYAFFRTDRKQVADLIAGTQVLQNVPRKKAPKKRWLIGGILAAYFVLSGLATVWGNVRTLRLSPEGLSMQLPQKNP